jgi:hypothetical protein
MELPYLTLDQLFSPGRKPLKVLKDQELASH